MSFFLRWQQQQPTNVSLFASATMDSPMALTRHQDGFSLESASAPMRNYAGSLRYFGADFTADQLATLLQQFHDCGEQSCKQPMHVTLFTPHSALAPAIRIDFSQSISSEALARVKQWGDTLDGELVYLSTPVLLSQPGLCVMDMDSTAITIECIDEIAKLAGVGAEVAAVTQRAMNGELDFAQSLQQRVKALAGTPATVLQQVLNELPLMPGLAELVAHLQQHQWKVAIASGGFTFFTSALQQRLDLVATFANQLAIVDGLLTGEVVGDIVDAKRKAEVVQELATQFEIIPQQTVAIGDGANDLPMLKTAALGVAFHAKPLVQAQAKAAIRQGSLLQLLYLLD